MIRGGNGHDILNGGKGNDLLTGGNGHDVLAGGNGADQLKRGAGADRLSSGNGADTFLFTDALHADGDRITDFRSNQGDVIDLSGIDARARTGAATRSST